MKDKAVRLAKHAKHHGLLLFVFGFLVLTLITTLSSLNQKTNTQTHAESPATGQINKKVFAIIYNPVMPNGQQLITYMNWPQPANLIQSYTSYMKQITANRVNYTVTAASTLQIFPRKADGFQYTAQSYAAMLAARDTHHVPDGVDYYQMFTDTSLDICGKVNRGEVDEVWLFGGPWMGFYESTLATSPSARPGFDYNDSNNTIRNTTCNRLVPVMGYNYEVGLNNMVHDLGHRTEATMNYVYGGWDHTKQTSGWERFSAAKYRGSTYSVFGCGYIHYPPNTLQKSDEYNYAMSGSVPSNCDDYVNFPSLGNSTSTAKTISCQAWGCNEIGYYTWWFTHIPHFSNSDSDGILNDWWQYIIDPNKTPYPATSHSGFRSVSADFATNTASFTFKYGGWSSKYTINVSTTPDMSKDVYANFVSGSTSPLIEVNPQKWDKYTCGRQLYWRISTSEISDQSPIVSTQVNCASAVPTPVPNTWSITLQPRCSDGSTPTQKYRTVLIHWPLPGWTASYDLPQLYGTGVQGDQTLVVTRPSSLQSTTRTYIGLTSAEDPNGLFLQATGPIPIGMNVNRYFCYNTPGTNTCSSAPAPWFVQWNPNSMAYGGYTIKLAASCTTTASIKAVGSTMTYTAQLVNDAGAAIGNPGYKVCTNKNDCAVIQSNGSTGIVSLPVGSGLTYKDNEWVTFTLTTNGGSMVNKYHVKNYGKFCEEATSDVRGSVLCDFISNSKQFKVRMKAGKAITLGWTLSGVTPPRVTFTPAPTFPPTGVPTVRPTSTPVPTIKPTSVPFSTIRSFNQSAADVASGGRLKQTVIIPNGTKAYSRFYENGAWQAWASVDVVCTSPSLPCFGIPGVSTISSFSQAPNPQGQPKQDVLDGNGTVLYSRVYSGGWSSTWSSVAISALGISGVSSARSFDQSAGDVASGGRLKQTLVTSNGSLVYYRFYENGVWQAWTPLAIACPNITTPCFGLPGSPSSLTAFSQAPDPQGNPKQDVLSSGNNFLYTRVYAGGWPSTWQTITVSSLNVPQ